MITVWRGSSLARGMGAPVHPEYSSSEGGDGSPVAVGEGEASGLIRVKGCVDYM